MEVDRFYLVSEYIVLCVKDNDNRVIVANPSPCTYLSLVHYRAYPILEHLYIEQLDMDTAIKWVQDLKTRNKFYVLELLQIQYEDIHTSPKHGLLIPSIIWEDHTSVILKDPLKSNFYHNIANYWGKGAVVPYPIIVTPKWIKEHTTFLESIINLTNVEKI